MSFRFFGALLATRMTLRDALTTFLSAQKTLLVGSSWRFVQHGDEALVGVTLPRVVSDGVALAVEIAVTALYRNLVHWLVSLRSLRRHLAAEDTTLTALLEAELHGRATDLLKRRALSLADIAERLGYHEVNSFQRAFRRWSGVTPAEYRRRAGWP